MPTPEDTSQTPDNPSFVSRPAPDGYRCAGAWIRLAALMIDGLVLFAKVVTRDGDLVMVGAVSGFEDQQGASASPRRRAAWSSGSLDGSWPSSRASCRTLTTITRQTIRFVGFDADCNTGILTRRIGNSSLWGVRIWLPGDHGATT
jgi:hypothetical protein